MNDNRMRVLDMLADGKITADEAARLLSLVEERGGRPSSPEAREQTRPAAKYLRVVVEPGPNAPGDGGDERINVRVPMALIRAGMKLAVLVPPEAATGINEALRRKGVNLDVTNLKTDDIEQLIEALRDLEVDVETPEQRVRIYVE